MNGIKVQRLVCGMGYAWWPPTSAFLAEAQAQMRAFMQAVGASFFQKSSTTRESQLFSGTFLTPTAGEQTSLDA